MARGTPRNERHASIAVATTASKQAPSTKRTREPKHATQHRAKKLETRDSPGNCWETRPHTYFFIPEPSAKGGTPLYLLLFLYLFI